MTVIRSRIRPAGPTGPLLMPSGRMVRVQFDMILPNAATREDVQEWLNLHMGCGSMANDNPLGHYQPEAYRPPVFQDLRHDSDFLERREDALSEVSERMLRPEPSDG